MLDLHSNHLSTLSDVNVAALQTLQVLNLENNKLHSIPPSVGMLAALQTLNLRGMCCKISLTFNTVIFHFITLQLCRVVRNKLPSFCHNSIRYDRQNSFTDTLGNKFALIPSLKISPLLKHVATLPCEMLLSAVEY